MEDPDRFDKPPSLGCAVLMIVPWAVVFGIVEVVVFSEDTKKQEDAHFPFFTLALTFVATVLSTFRRTQMKSNSPVAAVCKSIGFAVGLAFLVCAGSFAVGGVVANVIFHPGCSSH